jgi:hypothetical protein
VRARRDGAVAAASEVVVQLGPTAASLVDVPQATLIERALDSDLTLLLERLGIGGEVRVRIRRTGTRRPARVLVRRHLQPFPPTEMLRAWLAAAPAELHELLLEESDDRRGRAFPDAWIAQYASRSGRDRAVVAAWLERLVYQTILENPASLVGRRQLDAYARQLPGCSAREVREIVPRLLDLGVSVADRSALARELSEARRVGRSAADTVEAAFTELRSHRVELHVSPTTLDELVGSGPTRPQSVYTRGSATTFPLFRKMEATFYSAFGFRLPDIVWVPSASIPERSVAIGIDQWLSLPIPMPEAGLRLVNASPSDLVGLKARAAVHPFQGSPCALVPDDVKTKNVLEGNGYITWGPVDFVILNLYGELERRPQRLLGIEELEFELARLSDTGAATTVSAALAHYTLGDLTRIGRMLLSESLSSEGLSLRDLTGLLARLVEFDFMPIPVEGVELLDERLPVPEGMPTPESGQDAHYAFLRRRLAATLSRTHTWYGKTIVGYGLHPQLDAEAAQWTSKPPTDARAEALRDAVWREVLSVSRMPLGQVVFTSDRVRPAVRAVLAPELPELPVLASGELLSDVEVEEIATIQLQPRAHKGGRTGGKRVETIER